MMILELPMTDRGGKWELRGEGRVQEGLDDHFNKKTQTTGSEGVMPTSTPLSHLPLPIAKETERSSRSGPLFWFGRPKAPFPGRVGCAFWGAFSYSEKEACYYSLVSGSFRRKK